MRLCALHMNRAPADNSLSAGRFSVRHVMACCRTSFERKAAKMSNLKLQDILRHTAGQWLPNRTTVVT